MLSASTNPVFQRIKIALAEAEANVASLRSRVSETEGRLSQLRAAAGKVPQIEAELAQLNRDYEVLQKNYQQLVSRRESASLGEDVNSAGLAEFRIIDPPRVAPNPVFPNRLALIFVSAGCRSWHGFGCEFRDGARKADFSCGGSATRIHPKASPGERVDVADRCRCSAPALCQCRFWQWTCRPSRSLRFMGHGCIHEHTRVGAMI